jgi:hypothetical protein
MNELWWCEEHQSPTGDLHIDGVSRCFLALDEGLRIRDCRFVQQVRLPLDGIDVEGLRLLKRGGWSKVASEAVSQVLAAIDPQEDTK